MKDGRYGWGDPRCGGTHGILVLSYLAVILRDRSCIHMLIGIENLSPG